MKNFVENFTPPYYVEVCNGFFIISAKLYENCTN